MAQKLQKFYGKLFEWEINADNPMGYGLVKAAGPGSIGGGIGPTSEGTPGHVTFFVQVPDLAACLKKAESLGGKILVPITEIPNIVTFALFQDPEGNAIGLVKG
ncbi:MAG: VOC family protein [Acidobacteriia bacterium]|nr:VOC family protein [Terriglobia bacterium]